MKAAVLTAERTIEIGEIPDPLLGSGDVLVKIEQCGICTLEQRLFTGELNIGYPIIPGHEAAGTVVEVGSEVHAGIVPGDPVALDLVTRCGECHFCRTGRSNMCRNRFSGNRGVLGGFGEYAAVPASQVYVLSQDIPFSEAALSEPLSCAIHALKTVRLTLGDDLLILGAGPMGMLNLLAARAMGARVFVADPDATRCRAAERLGAAGTGDPGRKEWKDLVLTATSGRGVDAVVITSPARAALDYALEAAAPGGRITIFTSYSDPPPVPLDAHTLHRNEYLITGSEGRTEMDFYQAVRIISHGTVSVKPLISAEYQIAQINEAMKAAMSSDTYRVMVSFGEQL